MAGGFRWNKNTISPYNCKVCGNEFNRHSGPHTICDNCKEINKKQVKKEWDKNNHVHITEYSHASSYVNNRNRATRRRYISDVWGRDGRVVWGQAEQLATEILSQEGYEGIVLMTSYHRQSPFDIIAFKDDQGYVFQVTTRIHTDKKAAHRMARDMRLIHKALFVCIPLRCFVIKDFSPSGLAELGVEEVDSARKF